MSSFAGLERGKTGTFQAFKDDIFRHEDSETKLKRNTNSLSKESLGVLNINHSEGLLHGNHTKESGNYDSTIPYAFFDRVKSVYIDTYKSNSKNT